MKLLTLTIDFPPMTGGVARYTEALCKHFSKRMSVLADIDVDEEQKGAYKASAVFSVEYKKFIGGRWPTWSGAMSALNSIEHDVVLVHHVLPLGLVCWLKSFVGGKPYIVVLHGMDFALATRNAWKRFLLRCIMKRASGAVVTTNYLARQVKNATGVEAMIMPPLPAIIGTPNNQQREDGRVELLTVARMVERKGVQRVLSVLASDRDLSDRVHYTIVGDGAYAPTIKKLIESHHLEGVVSFHNVPDEFVIRKAYEDADLFLMPTITAPGDREGFGIVYLEAATFGLPSIASRIPGVDEAVLDGQTGVLVENDEELRAAIWNLVHDPSERRRLGRAARDRIEKQFTPEKVFAPLQGWIDRFEMSIKGK